MTRKTARTAAAWPFMAAEMAMASWETIARRTFMMATNTCSPAEYQRMVREKATASTLTAARLMATGGQASIASLMSPWHRRATANAKRLRKG